MNYSQTRNANLVQDLSYIVSEDSPRSQRFTSKSSDPLIAAVNENPWLLSARLDLADSFQRSRKSQLAHWVRGSLARSQAFAPLGSCIPAPWVCSTVRFATYLPPSRDIYSTGPLAFDQSVQLPYWHAPQHCEMVEYYGRWIAHCRALNAPSNPQEIDELKSMLWLNDLNQDGLLECIAFSFGRAKTVDWFFESPSTILNLPIYFDTARAVDHDFDASVSKRLLSHPSLIGLYLLFGLFPRRVVDQLPTLANRLKFLCLSVDPPRRPKGFDELLAGLSSMPQLRYLMLFDAKISYQDSVIISRMPHLMTLGISSAHLTSDQLHTLGNSPNLKWLGINSRELKRSDIDSFRRQFPHINLMLSLDMHNQLGPVELCN